MKQKRITGFEISMLLILGVLAIITIYPFYNVVLLSIATVESVAAHELYILPYAFDFSSYLNIIKEQKFLTSFQNSLFITIGGVALSMVLSVVGAYALSKKKLPGRNIIFSLILFTMFFNGGLIPYYLVINSMGLVNNRLVMMIPAAISTFYLIIMKNYFSTLPESLEESAKIDGASELTILLKIIIPISAPFMATFALFYAVDRWNEWWYALIFINDSTKIPLQIYLREVLINFNMSMASMATSIRASVSGSQTTINTQGLQMASIVVTALPIVLVYPFLQKHFARGIMVGAIKE